MSKYILTYKKKDNRCTGGFLWVRLDCESLKRIKRIIKNQLGEGRILSPIQLYKIDKIIPNDLTGLMELLNIIKNENL